MKSLPLLLTGALVLAAPLVFADGPPADAIGTKWVGANAKTMSSNFLVPPDDCRPGTYWWWQGGRVTGGDSLKDGGVTREEITRHLKMMKDAGLGVAHIVGINQPVKPAVPGHPGWLPPGSPEWADMAAHCIEEAAKVGMKVEISPYPNWPMSGAWAPNKLTEQILLRSKAVLKGPQQYEGPLPELSEENKPESKYEEFAKRWRRYNKNAEPQPQLVAVTLSQKGQPGKVVPVDPQNGNTVSVEIPEGEWELQAFWKLDGYWRVLDHYSGEAVTGQLEWAIKPVLDRIPKELVGSTFQGLYCDNIEGFHDSPWTEDMLAYFREKRGYDLTPYLPMLFDHESDVCLMKNVAAYRNGPSEGLRNRLVYDYNVTTGESMHERFYGGMTRWCHEHGLASRIEAHNPTRGDYVDGYGSADIPEFEAFALNLDPRTGKWLGRFAGHTYGKNVVACESFTWLTPHFRATPQEIREAVDRVFSFGANRINNHGWSYSPAAAGWPGWFFYASSNLNQNNSWLPAYRALADYKARMSMLLRCGRPGVDICFYADHVLFYSGSQKTGLADVGLKDRIAETPDSTKPSGIYDRISDKVLRTRMEVRDGKLVAGLGTYSLMVLRPEAGVMPLETLQKIEQLVTAGGKVAVLKLPTKVPGFSNFEEKESQLNELSARLFPQTPGLDGRQVGQGKTWYVTPEMLPQLVAELGLEPPVTGAGLDFVHRKGGDFDLFFLYNPSQKPVDAPIGFRAEGRAELWDAKTGEIQSLAAQRNGPVATIPMEITGKASRVVVFRRDNAEKAPDVLTGTAQTLVSVAGPWQVHFQHVDGRAPFDRAFDKLDDWRNMPGLEHFSGAGCYKTTFRLAEVPQEGSAFLDLGEVKDAAIVQLNGKPIGTVFEAPYRIRIPAGLLREGDNNLEVTVYNRMENAIFPIWQSNEEMRKLESQMRSSFLKNYWHWDGIVSHPSGLLGPTTISFFKK
jgi:hypothetical protein